MRLLLQHDALAFLSAVIATAALTPVAIRIARRLNVVDRPAPHKFHQQTTPYLGGLVIGASALTATIVLLRMHPGTPVKLIGITVGATLVAAVGLIDDLRVLQPWPRLVAQAGAGVIVWQAGVRLTTTGWQPLDMAATVLIVVTVSNAVNLIDNMDGIATGVSGIAAVAFCAIGAWQGRGLDSVLTAALAGACLGFLPFNFPPARIFLGDAGTLLLGFLLSVSAIGLDLPGYPAINRVTVGALVLWVPLFDMTLVVWSRRRAGRPIFRGGTDHSSHRLLRAGATHAGATVASYAAAALAGLAAAAVLLTHSLLAGVSAALAAAWVSIRLGAWMERVQGGEARAATVKTIRQPEPESISASPIPSMPGATLRPRPFTLPGSR
jgi:UDP-GlcNAc:undecaprenyl-phosphate/decaprenyl-phosphate GlcNAc-1-phosphate transferase